MNQSKFIKKQTDRAKLFIERFFENKEWFCGGPIPQSELLKQSSVDTVIGTEFCKGIETIYALLEKYGVLQEKSQDIRFVLKQLKITKQAGIPKSYQAGMILLYLKFCKGLLLPKLEFDVSHLKSKKEDEAFYD